MKKIPTIEEACEHSAKFCTIAAEYFLAAKEPDKDIPERKEALKTAQVAISRAGEKYFEAIAALTAEEYRAAASG